MRTLRFTINNQDIDMGESNVNYLRQNPMFEKVGTYTLPFKIQKTLLNESILSGRTLRYAATLHIGPFDIVGEYVKSKTLGLYYEGYFTTGNSTFRDTVRGVNLNDLDYTEVIPGNGGLSYTDALEAAARSNYPTYNYTCFPFLAPNYYDGNPFTYNSMINPWSTHPTVPALEGFYPSGSRALETLYAPSFYLGFVIEKIFSIYGYAIESNDMLDDTEQKTLCIPNFNTKGENDTTFQQYDLKFSEALPPVEINKFISDLESFFNITFFISEISKVVNIRKKTPIVKSTPIRELPLIERIEDQEDTLDGFSLKYTMDPEDTHSKITEIGEYSLGLTVSNKEDLSGYPAGNYKNQLALISNNDLYYLSKLTDASTDTWAWQEYTKDYFDYLSDGEELSIDTDINPILTDNDFLYSYYGIGLEDFALFPKVGGMSSTNSDGVQEYKTFDSVRLLFYRGIVDSGGGIFNPTVIHGQYPLATPDVYRPKGVVGSPDVYGRIKITAANQSLRWGGTYGLYETNWKDYLYWFINIRKSSTDYYQLTLAEFFGINFWEKYLGEGVSILFRSMELNLDFRSDTITIGKCVVYQS